MFNFFKGKPNFIILWKLFLFFKFPFVILPSQNNKMEQLILKKATDLFLKFGFKNVTMDDIANELGISKKTIYINYENKTELVEASVNYLFDEIISIIRSIQQRQLNPIEQTYTIFETISDLLKDENESIEYQLRKYFPEIHEKNNYTRNNLLIETITTNIEQGIKEGVFRDSIDINFLSKYFLTLMIYIKSAQDTELNEFNIKYASTQFIELYFRSIVTEKGLKILEQFINKTV